MNKQLAASYTEFEKVKEQFTQRIVDKTEEQRLFQPAEDAWSMLGVLEHIVIAEMGILGFLKKNPPSESTYKIGIKNKISYKLLVKFFQSSGKVKTPVKGLDPTGEKSLEELLVQTQKNSLAIKKILEDFPENKLKYSVFKHPIAGGMSMQHTVDFCKNHMIHHSHQLDRIEGHVNYPKGSV